MLVEVASLPSPTISFNFNFQIEFTLSFDQGMSAIVYEIRV